MSLFFVKYDWYLVYTAGLVSTTLMLVVFLILFSLVNPFACCSYLLDSSTDCLDDSEIFIMFGQCCRHFVKNGLVTPTTRAGLYSSIE